MTKINVVQCPICLGTGETPSEDPLDSRKYECWHCHGDGEVAPKDDPAVLAEWTHHHPHCARSQAGTAWACTCGLDDAWRHLYREPV